MTKLRLLLLATTTLSVAQFTAPVSHALEADASFRVAQAAPAPEGEPKAPPKAEPKGPPPAAAPRPAAPPAAAP
ncbi:hypothetical protein, partial [Tardiphaga sp.]|uniref:hypothetical protein n=1 Tax=Tardiphaga sp. TaxID=1926292 RepID=UPI0025ED092E